MKTVSKLLTDDRVLRHFHMLTSASFKVLSPNDGIIGTRIEIKKLK